MESRGVAALSLARGTALAAGGAAELMHAAPPRRPRAAQRGRRRGEVELEQLANARSQRLQLQWQSVGQLQAVQTMTVG